MKSDDAVQRLKALLDELAGLRPDSSSAEFVSWQLRARSALTHALREHHYITQEFIRDYWSSLSGDPAIDARFFNEAATRARNV